MELLGVPDRNTLVDLLRRHGVRFHEDRTGAIFCNAVELQGKLPPADEKPRQDR